MATRTVSTSRKASSLKRSAKGEPSLRVVHDRLRLRTDLSPTSRQRAFARLAKEAAGCELCPRMAHKRAVLGPLNGTLQPRVLFVGEAPGRRGADRTRRPFTGDASGQRFDELLAAAGLSREVVFITNAVLCCPADERRNHTPTPAEIRNCAPFLQRVIELLAPPVVATVGRIALEAVARLLGRPFELRSAAGTMIETGSFLLVPLYHPSPRVLHTVRSMDQQRADFAVLGNAVGRTTGDTA